MEALMLISSVLSIISSIITIVDKIVEIRAKHHERCENKE